MGGPHPRRPTRLNPPPRGFQAPTPRAAAEKHPTTGTRQASHSRASCSRTSHSRVSHSRASPTSRSLFCFAIVNVRIYESNKISYYILLSTYKKNQRDSFSIERANLYSTYNFIVTLITPNYMYWCSSNIYINDCWNKSKLIIKWELSYRSLKKQETINKSNWK
jgi:hypothetical protein